MTELPSVITFSVDLANAEAPAPLPTGTYRGVVRSVEVKESQRGTKYAAVAFHISSDQYPADYKDGNLDGTTLIYRRASLEDTPQSRYGLRRFIEAIGAPLGKKIDVAEWGGSEAALEIAHEEYEGVNRANIVRVRAA